MQMPALKDNDIPANYLMLIIVVIETHPFITSAVPILLFRGSSLPPDKYI